MTTHSSILAWRIPWTEEPGGLQSMGTQRVRHVLATKQECSHSWRPVLQREDVKTPPFRKGSSKRSGE